jgi:hypothetical protein
MNRVLLCLIAVVIISCKTTQQKASTEQVASLWDRVADEPPTYIPKGYAKGAPRTKSQGEWYSSKRDGRRFFVPDDGAAGNGAGVLRRSALRAIDRPVNGSGAAKVTDLAVDGALLAGGAATSAAGLVASFFGGYPMLMNPTKLVELRDEAQETQRVKRSTTATDFSDLPPAKKKD